MSASLEDSDTRTVCPYKGVATYYGVRVGDRLVPDAAWTYPEPLGEALAARDHLCLMGDETVVTVDGEKAA